MSALDIGTILVVFCYVGLFLGLVMVLFWGTRKIYPGFGLWTLGAVLIALAIFFVSDRRHHLGFVTTLIVPGFMTCSAALRLEGLRRFLGRKRLDYRVLLVPIVVMGLAAYFSYGRHNLFAQIAVTAVPVALIFWAMAIVIVRGATGDRKPSYRIFGAMFAVYGALLLSCALVWLTQSKGSPLEGTGPLEVTFFILVMLSEIAWAIVFLAMNTGRTQEVLEIAQKKIESSRSQLADIVAFLPDATFALDADHRVVAWNKAAEELTGVPAEQVLGKTYEEGARQALGDNEETLLDLAADPNRAVPERYYNVVREEDRLFADVESEFKGRPGRTPHLWLAASVLRDPDGTVTGAIESMRDITAREQADRVIRQREQQYRSLFELNLDGILAIAPDGTVQDANPAACRMLGMTKEEVRAAGRAGIVVQGSEVDARPDKRPPSGTPSGAKTTQYTLRRKDGTTFPAECMSVSYCDVLGFPRAFIALRDVTERVKAQQVLRESEARLLQAQAVAHVGNWEIDLEARSVWLSPEALRMHGFDSTPEYFPLEMNGLVNGDLGRLAEDPGLLAGTLEQVVRVGGSFDLEYQIRRLNDGATRRVHAKGEAVCDETDRPVKVVGVVQDITELRQVEDALGLTEYSVEHAEEQTFWVGPDGRFFFVSDSTCNQLGYTREELLGMTLFDVDPTLPRDRTELEGWDEVRRRGSFTHEAVHRTKDGRDIPVAVNAHYVEHNGQEYNFVIARDISKRKEMEDSFRVDRLSADHAGDQVFWISQDGRLRLVSDSTCQQLGYSQEELLGMTIYDIDPTLSKDWSAGWARVKQRGSHTHETVHRTKDGKDVPVEVSANYISQGGQEYNLVFAHDISERKRSEPAAADSEEKLRQAQTMEAIGQLAGGIAHDFNNLLTAIIGYGNLILSNEEVQGLVVRGDAEEIRAAAERASALTQQILAFSRRQVLKPRVMSLNRLISDMQPRLREIFGEDVEISSIQQRDLGHVEVDRQQFERVLVNLATNARDAMPDGGRLILETRNVELNEEYCRVYPDLLPGSYVLLSVSDTGVGMTPETMGHVFEPFFTTKEPGLGAGLGLSSVYGVVRQSGGYVTVYSEVNKGSTIKVYLPRVPEPAEVETEPDSVLASSVKGETILVVEDEAPLRRLIARVLGGIGYRVFVAGSGPEALELLDDLERPPDLLLTDVILPGGMQGNDVAAACGARVPGLPVLYVSGHARDAIVHSGRLDEGVNFLGKPFTPESLAAKVREVLDARARKSAGAG